MSVVSIDKLWDEINALTADIHRLAKEQEWEQLVSLHEQRKELLVRLVRVNNDQAGLRVRLTELLLREKELLELCNTEKQNVAKQLRDLRQGQQAKQTYSQR
jgi:hypothetical protein